MVKFHSEKYKVYYKIRLVLFSSIHNLDVQHIYTTSCIKLQGLISGSAETKEQAAEGLGELIDVTSEKTLKEVVVPVTGYGFLIFVKITSVFRFHHFLGATCLHCRFILKQLV